MKLSTDFDKIGFHDASIEKVERQPGSIVLELKGGFISREHQNSKGHDWNVEEARLEIRGVTEEKAIFWDDDKIAKDHPDPDLPLDEIMNANFKEGVFLFDGFKKTEPWYEWMISASSFILEVRNASKINN